MSAAGGTRVLLTGGGTAGHVMPNLVLARQLRAEGIDVIYVGQRGGVEETLVGEANIEFHGIPAGKLRRYLSLENLLDVFRVLAGVLAAWRLLGRLRPAVVFSKGGFVTFPVVLAAALRRLPVISHESDLTPGLATRLSLPFVSLLLTAFPETRARIRHPRVEHLGMPMRPELARGSAEAAASLCGFGPDDRPTLLIMGGSLGSEQINRGVRDALDELLRHFRVVHLTGPGRLDASLRRDGYAQFEFVTEELGDLFALADVVVSRAGATTLFELIALRKAHVLVPLSLAASRGDQIANAGLLEAVGISVVLDEQTLDGASLRAAVAMAVEERDARREAMVRWLPDEAAGERVVQRLVEYVRQHLLKP